MKKKIIIPLISLGVLIVIGITVFLLLNSRVKSYIIIDINPSIRINLDKNNKVIDVIALDKDAKKITTNDLKGKSYDKALQEIGKRTTKYSKDNNITILLYTKNISSKIVEQELNKPYVEYDIHPEIIVIDKITNEDKSLSRKYKITELKAHYINSIKKQYKDIPVENLVETPIYSLKETKEKGKYCDEGYFLDGDRCLKEKERVKAKYGLICAGNSFEEDGVCYEQAHATFLEEYECEEHRTLGSDNKCHNTITQDVIGKCENGEYDRGTKKCKVKEKVAEATEICRITRETDILMDHKCYGPKPTINGGCLGSDVIINGGCVDLSRYYESDWECPNGEFLPQNSDDHNCYEEKIVDPTSFYCEEKGFKIVNGECIKEETAPATHKFTCPEGSTKLPNGCIYKNKTMPKVEGYYCDYPNSRLEGENCIIYTEKEAK